MPHDLALPNLTGQIPYDVEEAIDRLRGYSVELGATQALLETRLSAMGDGAQDALAEASTLVVATLETTDLISTTITTTELISTTILVAPQLESTIATGTAPLIVASTTLVANLNADFLDGVSLAGLAQVSGVPVNNQVAIWVSAGAIEGDGNFTFDGTTLTLTGDIDLSGQTVDVTLNAAADALNFDSNTLSINASNNRIGIGTIAPDTKLHVYLNDTDVNFTHIKLEQDGTGDASLVFNLTGIINWGLGIDNSDSDKFKIARGSDISSSTALTINQVNHVGIGTANPGQILDINQGSGNMIADGYDNHSLRQYKEAIEEVSQGFLARFQALKIFQYTRRPHVSAEELRDHGVQQFGETRWNHVFPDGYRGGELDTVTDPEMKAFLDMTAESLRATRRTEPYWQTTRYGLIADEESLAAQFPELITRDTDQEPVGISLVDYVGMLHAVVKELSGRLEFP